MAQAQKQTAIVLILTEEEAGVLVDVLGSVGGSGRARELSDDVYNQLEVLGLAVPDDTLKGDLYYTTEARA